jgi:hypothetical protein
MDFENMTLESQTSISSDNRNNKGKVISNLNYDLQYFVNLDSENKICFDCGGPFPTYVSINNGAFICSNCANNHSKLGYNISFIHQINSPWDPYLLSYACRGGNSRFKRLCAQYEVPCQSYNENDSEKLNKYLIRLGEYHRLLLRSEVLAEEPPKPLYFEVAKNKCDLNTIYFPEFENYHLYTGEVVVPGKQYSIGGKIWNGTKTTAGIMGTAGGIVYKVGKPVVCFLGKTAFNGIKFLGKSIYHHYYPEKDKNNKDIMNGNKIMNDNYNNSSDFALVDYADEDLKETKIMNINSFTDNGNNNINNNNMRNNFNYNNQGNLNNSNWSNNNKNNTYTINGDNPNNNINIINNGINNNQFGNLNNHNNIITNNDDLINNNRINNNYNPYNNKQSSDSLKNVIEINKNNNKYNDGFEILSNNNIEKDNNNSSNSLFDTNLYAGMNVQFENTDQKKARQDANNFLLKP